MATFGEPIRSEFLLSADFTFLNHGSYGSVARVAHEAKLKKQERFESIPDVWFRRERQHDYRENVRAAAKFVGADPRNTVLVANATTGMNAVFKSLKFSPADGILINTWTYGAMKKALTWVAQHTGATIYNVDIPLPIKSKQQIVDAYKDMLAKHKNIKFAIIDAISSVPPIYMPFLELARICEDAGCLVLIDGAHTPGQIPVNLEQWRPHFYVGNLHKWAYTPRGSAVLYIREDQHDVIAPAVASAWVFEADLADRFSYTGTDDSSGICAVKYGLQFYDSLGGLEAIGQYITDLVTRAAAMLVERWGTRMMDIPRDMEAPNMRMVRLPDIKNVHIPGWDASNPSKNNQGDLTELMFELMDSFKMMVLFNYLQGEPYVRISANVYNTMADFEKLADAILDVKKKAESK